MNISAEEFHIHFISYANIPFKAGIYASDLSIDWGDGTSSILKEKQYFNIVHHYQQEGLFHIKISGHRISNLNVSRLNLVDLQLEHCPSLEYLNCSIKCVSDVWNYGPVIHQAFSMYAGEYQKEGESIYWPGAGSSQTE